jgi:hypothetical protein
MLSPESQPTSSCQQRAKQPGDEHNRNKYNTPTPTNHYVLVHKTPIKCVLNDLLGLIEELNEI